MSTDYAVVIEPFAERHYIKSFRKKYLGRWDIAERAIIEQAKRIETLSAETQIAELMVDRNPIRIYKMEFRIPKTNESRKSSGNRCILAADRAKRLCRVLLVYSKDDLGTRNETATWKQMVRDEYPELREILK